MGLGHLVRTVLTADDMYRQIVAKPVDVVFADIEVMRPDPVQFTRNVLARCPRAGVVMVGSVDPRLAAKAIAAGARGVVRTRVDSDDLVAALMQAVMLVYPHGSVAAVPQQRIGPSGLTQRELQVLEGMSQGKSNAEIGRDLYVSEDTVKTHARRMFRKLGARDRAHAVAEAFRGGIVH